MPSSIVEQLIRDVAVLKTEVKNLMQWQKWQMGLLAAIFMLAIKNWVR